jgi:glycogen debranching enzyme
MVNPPLFAWIEWRYYLISGDDSRLNKVLPVLVRYYQWIDLHCRASEGKGLYYISPLGSGMDNTPRPDVGKGGWIDFSAQQALAAKSIAAIAGAVGKHDVEQEFLEKHRRIAELINTLCWNKEEQFYFDLTQSDTLSQTKHIGAFWTLLSNVSNREKAEGLVGHLQNKREFWRPHLVPTLSADDRNYDPKGHYWRGSVWAPTNYMVVKGLEEYQQFVFADDIVSNHLKNMTQVFLHCAVDERNVAYEERYGDGYHTIWECYSAERPEPATRWDKTFYSRQDFVGWSGLGPIAMLIENVLGISVEGYENRIRWRIHRTDRHGIENIRLRDQRVTLVCSPKKSGTEVTVTSEKAFSLQVSFRDGSHKELVIQKGTTTFSLE